MKLKIGFSIAIGVSEAGASAVPLSAILFNGVPLLFNGEYITFTN